MNNTYLKLIDQGWCPTWTGNLAYANSNEGRGREYCKGDSILVRLGKDHKRVWCVAQIPTLDISNLRHLVKYTAESPGSQICSYPSVGQQSLVRLASIAGIGPYSRPGYGIGTYIQEPSLRRIVGLDIEQTVLYRGGNFPLHHDPIVSIAITTWDKRYHCRYSMGFHRTSEFPPDMGYDVRRVSDSTALAEWAIDWLVAECPDFVVVHNGYSYDVRVLAVHCSPTYSRYFRSVNLGKADKGYDLNIPGVTMIDSYRYLDKLHRGEYDSLSLDYLTSTLFGIPKSNQPQLSLNTSQNHDMTDVIYYNIHDSALHVMVAQGTNCVTELVSMCSVFKCPISDASRFISGVMVSTMLASYAINMGCVVDWSDEKWPMRRYTGALVLKPKLGLHTEVSVLDVGAMYPSIMIDANISIETVYDDYSSDGSDDGSDREGRTSEDQISWDDAYTYVYADGMRSRISREPEGIVVGALRHLISTRRKVGKKTPTGWALKIGTNSMYGALGAKTSKIQSYRGASAVTAIGRLITTVLASTAHVMGFEAVYGDTDSVFLTKRSRYYITVDDYLRTVHLVLAHTPFSSVRLEFEKKYESLIIVKPKMYYGVSRGELGSDVVEVKGLASSRKDRPPMVRRLVSEVCFHICKHGVRDSVEGVAMLVADDIAKVQLGQATLEECSIERRKGGMTYLVHKDLNNQITWLRGDQVEEYKGGVSKSWVIDSITSALSPILHACSMPNVDSMCHAIERILV